MVTSLPCKLKYESRALEISSSLIMNHDAMMIKSAMWDTFSNVKAVESSGSTKVAMEKMLKPAFKRAGID